MLAQAAKRSPQTSLLLTTLAALVGLSALVLLLAATPAASVSASTRAVSASASGAATPTVVLVHGAWADASGWSQVAKRLQNHGYRVLAPANPLRSVEGDAAYLRLGGGCAGCGMATVTLSQGIEVAIRESVPEITRVVDVTDHASGTNPYFEAAKK